MDFFPVPAEADCDIAHLVVDSRLISKNDLFLAVKGVHGHGRQYISQAIARGARAILVEAEKANEALTFRDQVPLLPIYQLSHHLAALAARFYHHPAKKLRMIGVTGTSGKTSCTHFIAQSLQALHIPCGLIGTLGNGFFGELGEVGLTTPDAITLQAILQRFVEQKAEAIAMEVSSHSIAQGRVSGIEFEMGLFTNLSQDHLDYHGDMKTYAAVKRQFLSNLSTKQVIINADDAHGQQWIAELADHKPVYAYGTEIANDLPATVAHIVADHVELSLQGIKAHVTTPWGKGKLVLPLIGQFNLSNALAALTALCLYDIPLEQALNQLSELSPVPGRMQLLGGKHQPLVVVDYAHKPDALEKVLQALRAHGQGKLLCVFGCGGERDRGKRPLMAAIAERWADQIIVTNDNPRHENPTDIAAEIMRGFSHPERVKVELDRSQAILHSIEWASAKDCVLIAGKGAEHYQQIGDEKFPFDDAEKVAQALQKCRVD